MDKVRLVFLMIALSATSAYAQVADSVSGARDPVFNAEDSLSIFNLIDSIMEMDTRLGSQLAIRLSYNSNVLSAGRTLGIQNFGLAPGLSYYHSSGLYADVAAYWSKDFVPSYYLTIASAGYLRTFSKRFSIMAEYDRYFYRIDGEGSYIPYRNTLSVTPVVDLKYVSFSTNYSFYFGDQYAHRLMPGVSFTLAKKKFWLLDRISLMPSFYVLTGNEKIYTQETIPPQSLREAIENLKLYGTRYRLVQHEKNVFGIMNYAFSVPLTISYNRWSAAFTYVYNIPKALPGEPLTLSESSYLSGSLLFLIDLPRKEKDFAKF